MSAVCFVGGSVGIGSSRRQALPDVRRRYARGFPSRSGRVDMVMPAPAVGAAVGFAALAAVLARSIKKVLDTPSRPYNGSFDGVGKEYDEWTNEGILEKFWGEHIHLGYYTEEERASGWWKANFKQAKYVFVDKMMEWGDADNLENAERILDVGCGFGGTSRILAKKYPDAKVTGITLSREQVRRGTELAVEQGLANVEFKAMDALHMEYEDNTFDLVWACESGEHMPDKQKYIEEMTRVLKPGGKLIVACWCQRETPPKFSQDERSRLQFLYDEWSHPFFISIEQFARFMKGTGRLERIRTDNWVQQTIASWRHSILVGIVNPWPVVFSSPVVWWKVIREIVCIERMHRAFRDGLMTYGMIKAVKKIQN